MNTILFDKGLATLDRTTLRNSASYELAKGLLPMSRPVPHHQLLNDLIGIAAGVNGITIEEEPIYATEAQSMRVMWAGKKEECPIENYLIQRLATRFHLRTDEDKDFNMAVGVAYNEKGISLAFGANVRVCSNQNIFGENIMHTFGGDRKVPYSKMMEVFQHWMNEFESKRFDDYELISSMQKREITEDGKQLLFGKLIENATRANMRHDVIAPLNVTQVGDFIRASYSPEYQVTERLATVWDLQQMGTSILKPTTTDLVTMFESNHSFNQFLLTEFNLN